jgi:hypothetical protein
MSTTRDWIGSSRVCLVHFQRISKLSSASGRLLCCDVLISVMQLAWNVLE